MLIQILLLGLLVMGTVICLGAALILPKEKKVSLADRIKALSSQPSPEKLGVRDQEEMEKSFVERVVLPFASKAAGLFSAITPTTMVAKADQMILEAGLFGKVSGIQLTTISWLLAAGLPIVVLLLFLPHVALSTVQHDRGQGGRIGIEQTYVAEAKKEGKLELWQVLAVAGLAALIGYRLPRGIVEGRAAKRKHEIQLALPFTFDLISISVEAGMSLDGAINEVANRTKGALADELKATLREINLGYSRAEALENLAKRTGVEDLRTFISAVNFISRMGGSIVDVIKIQTESLRVKRRQRAEKAANQTPVKMMIPLVLFILPCLFIVILGPVVLEVIKQTAK